MSPALSTTTTPSADTTPSITRLPICFATLKDSVLTIGNSLISRMYDWNNGHIISKSITDRKAGYTWQLDGSKPDGFIPGTDGQSNGTFSVEDVAATSIAPAYLKVNITASLGSVQVKRVFRLYPDCPAIACELYYKGKTQAAWESTLANQATLGNIENAAALKESNSATPIVERLGITGNYLKAKAVQFYDITDRNNNLVLENTQYAYKTESLLHGNLLLLSDFSDRGLFILKEAPNANVQVAYPGYDFFVKAGEVKVAGPGMRSSDLNEAEWTRGYSIVTGLASRSVDLAKALRIYQNNVRIRKPGRDIMIMMNTWGDRSQDKKVGEKFALDELRAAARLGITHFQLDDGWQTGRSANSAFSGGSFNRIWDNPDYWKPDPVKFPNGLAPVVRLGKELGIEVCLWFNPSNDDDLANWRKDADALIYLYRTYSIRTFKIDGVRITSKQSDINFRKMFTAVLEATNNEAVFNLDATAGRRYGYHYFNEYGNIFLENRYTDWTNYYPHWTLRNLWMLSKYIPAQTLQIEFLNNFRNSKLYPPNDPLAPSKIPFEYTFAVTMMAQPLAWFEATGLPEEAFGIAPVIRKYRTIQKDIHAGMIFPIGQEPSGKSWSGFESVQKNNSGYVLVFRELNNQPVFAMETSLPEGSSIQFEPVLGKGKSFLAKVQRGGKVSFNLPSPLSYCLYRYKIK
ncbi:MAG: alpha-galactosidase [Chitinophagaceae bacterium]|nr:alpha-galactosidase [Chitinophagaceae bacterium]